MLLYIYSDLCKENGCTLFCGLAWLGVICVVLFSCIFLCLCHPDERAIDRREREKHRQLREEAWREAQPKPKYVEPKPEKQIENMRSPGTFHKGVHVKISRLDSKGENMNRPA